MTETPDPSGETTIGLRALQKTRPGWHWLQQNFSLPAVLTIGGIVVAGIGWVISLKIQVVRLQDKASQLQTEVIHVTKIVPDAAMLAGLRQQVTDHEGRITRIEHDWDNARAHVDDTPVPKKARKQP